MSSQEFASGLIAQLARYGVRNFYLSPGSRSQALALAANSLHEAGIAQLTVRLDERSLAFTALGAALASRAPVAVITTSGTAVANLHPAVLEAHHSGVPLLLLTADRPASLRGKGANQTTNQVGIFSDAVRLCLDVDSQANPQEIAHRAVSTAIGGNGPVQINIQFSEPLSDLEPTAAEIFQKLEPMDLDNLILSGTELLLEDPNQTAVIAGAGATGLAAAFAKRYSLPLFAEPSSDARYGDAVIRNYGALLATDAAKKIKQLVVFGKPTLNRSVIKLIQNPEVRVQVVLSPTHGHFDVASNAMNQAVSYKFAQPANPEWLASWKKLDVQENLTEELTRQGIIETLWQFSTADDAILLGASAIARDADKYAPAVILNVFSNRGLSGIDGTISTALGIAQQTEGITRALMGDLTFIHDLAALNKTGLANLDLQIIVVNDHGGKIFQRLEIAKLAEPASFEKLFKTPQQVSIEQVALAFGWNYRKPKSLVDYQQALRASGSWVIELELD